MSTLRFRQNIIRRLRLPLPLRAIFLPLLALLLLVSAVISCAVNVATGRRQFVIVSESREIALGKDADVAITASLGLYPDSALQAYVSDLGLSMAYKSERPNLPWTFRVIDDPIVNAFALPGGFIYITRGILVHLNSEAELCGVIGHEIGHVTGKHSVERMSTQQVAAIGLGVTSIVKPELQRFTELASAGLGLLFLKFGREDEIEADYLGLRYMTRINKDPREMAGVMSMLDEVTQASGGGRVPEWLSTHPDPGNRREHIESHIDTMTSNFASKDVNRERYYRMIDGIVFGKNPRHGFFKENVFFHPDLEFRLSFPAGWQTANQVQAVLGLSPKENAMIQLGFARAASREEAANAFFTQQGLSASGRQTGNINGLPASWGDFSAETETGTLYGTAYFVSYGDRIYELLAYGTSQGWNEFRQDAVAALRSFERLTDQKILSVQPHRLKVVAAEKIQTLTELVEQYRSPASVEKIALINRLEPQTRLHVGRQVKMIVGEPLP